MRTMRLFDPTSEFDALRREIDRAFSTFRPNGVPRNAFLPGRSPRNYPQVNIAEDEDAVYIEALAPGLDAENLNITVLRNQLTISGEKLPFGEDVSSEKVHRTERATGRFVRSFTLPTEVKDEKVSAEYKSGILRVKLPKAETAKPRKIEVAVG